MTYNCHFLHIIVWDEIHNTHKADNFLDGLKVYHVLWQEVETRKRMK